MERLKDAQLSLQISPSLSLAGAHPKGECIVTMALGTESPFSVVPESGDPGSQVGPFCQALNQPNPQSSLTRTSSIHKLSTLCRIRSVRTASSSTPSSQQVRESQQRTRGEGSLWTSIPPAAACSWPLLSMGVQGDTRPSCSSMTAHRPRTECHTRQHGPQILTRGPPTFVFSFCLL